MQRRPRDQRPRSLHLRERARGDACIARYDVPFYRLQGQGWTFTDGLDIAAKVPPDATKPQLRTMLQNLLEERLKVTIHRETRAAPSYSLVVGKGGPLIKPGPAGAPSGGPAQPLGSLAGYLSVRLQAEVVNETGLAGDYDFTLDFRPDATMENQNPAPGIVEALQSQPGLSSNGSRTPRSF